MFVHNNRLHDLITRCVLYDPNALLHVGSRSAHARTYHWILLPESIEQHRVLHQPKAETPPQSYTHRRRQ